MGDLSLTYGHQAISVDCVVFGFDGKALRVLLTRRHHSLPSGEVVVDPKLPGSLISDDEDLLSAAHRVTRDFVGARGIYLKQMEVFSDPQRVQGNELMWINSHYKVELSRVLTVVFFALVKLDERLLAYTKRRGGEWVELHRVRRLALDHNKILVSAIDHLIRLFHQEPIAFEFLPKKFTIRQLQNLYETALDIELDNRNFRKKMLALEYVVEAGEKEAAVAHKPAQLYYFDRKKYDREYKKIFKFGSVYK